MRLRLTTLLLVLLLTLGGGVEARCPRGKRGRRCRKRRTVTPHPTPSTPDPDLPVVYPPYPKVQIPLAFHVLYKDCRNDSDGPWAGKVWGNVSEDQVRRQVDVLNDAFSGQRAIRRGYRVEVGGGDGVFEVKDKDERTRLFLDTGVEFVLSYSKWYENSYFHEHLDPSVDWWWLCGLTNRQRQIKSLVGVPGHLNVYVCDNGATLGQAYFPWSVEPS